MKYTVSEISKQVGLTPQTIREYENFGLLISEKNPDNNYRYFDADAVNKAAAIRGLRNMGLSLSEIKHIHTDIAYGEYFDLIEREVKKLEGHLAYQRLILESLNNHATETQSFHERLNTCELVTEQAFYCLDFRHNDELLLTKEEDCRLLNSWMEKSFFTKCYSPFPTKLLYGEESDITIGFAVKEECAVAIGLGTKTPVYRRYSPLCIRALIHHTFNLRLLPDGPKFIHEYMNANNLSFAEKEPFMVSEIAFHHDYDKEFFANLYIPVQRKR